MFCPACIQGLKENLSPQDLILLGELHKREAASPSMALTKERLVEHTGLTMHYINQAMARCEVLGAIKLPAWGKQTKAYITPTGVLLLEAAK